MPVSHTVLEQLTCNGMQPLIDEFGVPILCEVVVNIGGGESGRKIKSRPWPEEWGRGVYRLPSKLALKL